MFICVNRGRRRRKRLRLVHWPPPAAVSPVSSACPTLRRSEEHTSELQSQSNLVCRLLLGKEDQTPQVPPQSKPRALLKRDIEGSVRGRRLSRDHLHVWSRAVLRADAAVEELRALHDRGGV